jgi:hypothetical protein
VNIGPELQKLLDRDCENYLEGSRCQGSGREPYCATGTWNEYCDPCKLVWAIAKDARTEQQRAEREQAAQKQRLIHRSNTEKRVVRQLAREAKRDARPKSPAEEEMISSSEVLHSDDPVYWLGLSSTGKSNWVFYMPSGMILRQRLRRDGLYEVREAGSWTPRNKAGEKLSPEDIGLRSEAVYTGFVPALDALYEGPFNDAVSNRVMQYDQNKPKPKPKLGPWYRETADGFVAVYYSTGKVMLRHPDGTFHVPATGDRWGTFPPGEEVDPTKVGYSYLTTVDPATEIERLL